MIGDFEPNAPFYIMGKEEPCEICGVMAIPSTIKGHKICGAFQCVRTMQKNLGM